MTMSKEDFDLLVSEELAACDRMLQWLEDDYNRPERIARRARIAEHIGRPICRDDLPSRKHKKLDEQSEYMSKRCKNSTELRKINVTLHGHKEIKNTETETK